MASYRSGVAHFGQILNTRVILWGFSPKESRAYRQNWRASATVRYTLDPAQVQDEAGCLGDISKVIPLRSGASPAASVDAVPARIASCSHLRPGCRVLHDFSGAPSPRQYALTASSFALPGNRTFQSPVSLESRSH
jgi:hypothetical protein